MSLTIVGYVFHEPSQATVLYSLLVLLPRRIFLFRNSSDDPTILRAHLKRAYCSIRWNGKDILGLGRPLRRALPNALGQGDGS